MRGEPLIMDPAMQQAISDQVIRYDDVKKGFECLICDIKLTGEASVQEHLKSSKHRDAGGRLAIENLWTSPKSIRDLLPEIVVEAVQFGDLKVSDSKEILCLVCNSPNQGIIAVEKHLQCKSHKKKKAARPQTEAHDGIASPHSLILEFSDPVIQKGIADKVIKYDEAKNRFECVICDVKLSGQPSVQDHLSSNRHLDVAGRLVLKDFESSSLSLRDLLPEIVIDAAQNGDLKLTDSKDILCLVCNSPNQGIITLEAHLQCNSHKKKMGTRVQSKSQNAAALSRSLSFTFQSPAVQQVVSENIVACIDGNVFQCTVCDCKFTGEKPLEQHLESKKHREAGARFAISNFSTAPRSLVDKLSSDVQKVVTAGFVTVASSGDLKCNICNVSLSGILSLEAHLAGDDHKKNALRSPYPSLPQPEITAASNAVSVSPTGNLDTWMDQLSLQEAQALTEAMELGIIEETDNKLDPFQCKLCDKKFNNSGPLLTHLLSKKHVEKQKKMSPPKRPQNSDEDNSEETTGASKKRYSVISDVRGHVYVFNYTFKGTSKHRSGAEHDSRNLENTFTKMGYEVFVFGDLTLDETKGKLEEIRRKPELNGIDSFIMCILSHGLNDYTFYTNDMEELDLRLIRKKFTDRKCPYLRGKPKIILANYCRGDQLQKKDIEEYDDIEAPQDMVTIHAATEGIMAKRTPSTGTIFVASFCEVLTKYAKEYDLRDIYHELEDIMKEKRGTRPMWEDYSFKHFNFNPKK